MKSKLEKLKAKDVRKIIEKKDMQDQQPPLPSNANIYDNSSLFKRETVENRLDQYKDLMGQEPAEGEEAPKSWIQIKTAAMAKRKDSRKGAASKASIRSKSKILKPSLVKKPSDAIDPAATPKQKLQDLLIGDEEEETKELIKRQPSDEMAMLNKTEAPTDGEDNKNSRNLISFDPAGM